MWLGAAGLAVQRLLDPLESITHLDWIRRLVWLAPENGQAFHHLAFFLPYGRVAVALATTLGLAALYPLLVRLFDRRVALLTVGLLAFDPFLIGHSGLLHTDALLATFSLLALVTALNGLREPRRVVWWAFSGLFTGLALLTKTPALILVPFILFLIAIPDLQSTTRNSLSTIRHWPSVIGHWSLFLLLIVITYLALYPALWVDPASPLRAISAFAGQQVEAAQRPIFFADQMTYDPGPAFYPTVFIFRISPVALVGLIPALIAVVRTARERVWKPCPDRTREPCPYDMRCFAILALITFAVGFGVLMSLGAKKHDRYLLPALLPLTLVAALGWEYLSKRVMSKRVNEYQTSYTLYSYTHILIFLIQLALALAFVLHPLTAFNPLVGGPWVAARVLSVDWGEGAGAAAHWLNQLPGADQLTVAASSVPSFAPLFDGHTLPLNRASLADYIVLDPNQPLKGAWSQKTQPPPPPAYAATFGFLDHAVVYTNTAPFEQNAYLVARAKPGDLILLDADTPLLRCYSGPGTLASIADLPDQASVAARLAELSASVNGWVNHSRLWIVADPGASPITAAHLRKEMETIGTTVTSATVASATISQYVVFETMPQSPIPNPQSQISTFGDHLILVDALLPAEPINAPFPVFLRWQALAPSVDTTTLHASLYLRDSANHLWAEVGQPVLNDVTFPTSAWASGEWADNGLTLKPPERIPPGIYGVQLTVTDSGGAQLGTWNADGRFRGVRVPLGDVEIVPPAEPVGPAPCTEDQPLTAGPILACVPDLPPQAIPSGDMLTLALTWSAITPPQADYSVRYRLVDGGGSVALEQTAALCSHATSRWRAGDSFESRYNLRFDPALPAAGYTLALNVLTPDGRPLWAKDKTLTAVEILPRERLFELPSDITHPLDLTLDTVDPSVDTVVHLCGFDLDHTQATPGDTLHLTLYWQAEGPTYLDYTVFVHLVGPDGRPHGQVDRFPAGGDAPTTSWAPGQVIVDEIVLPVAADAPAGAYHIAVGMYDAASGGRLPLTDDSGQFLPDDQAVLPVEITIAGGLQ